MYSLPHNQPDGAGDDGGSEPTTSTSAPRGRSFRAGIVAGCIGLVALVTGTTSLASAQAPTLDQDVSNSGAEAVIGGGIADEEVWQAYDSCMQAHLSDAGYSGEGFATAFAIDADAEFDVEFEELDAIFETADEVCVDELPEEVRAELIADGEVWEAFDMCLDGQLEAFDGDGVLLDEVHVPEAGVWVSDGDSESFVIFGDDAGSVTITGDANDLTIDGSGVEILEGEELDALFGDWDENWDEDMEQWEAEMVEAEASCLDELPEGFEAEFVDVFDTDGHIELHDGDDQ